MENQAKRQVRNARGAARIGLAGLLALPIVLGACAREPEPEPVAVPVLTSAEQACVNRAAETTGVDPATIAITPLTVTKSGETVYNVTAGGLSYSCTVGADLTVTQFAAG